VLVWGEVGWCAVRLVWVGVVFLEWSVCRGWGGLDGVG